VCLERESEIQVSLTDTENTIKRCSFASVGHTGKFRFETIEQVLRLAITGTENLYFNR
jgi:hypothetical protein